MSTNHCWHRLNLALSNYPSRVVERCCHCGAHRRAEATVEGRSACGPFAPLNPAEGMQFSAPEGVDPFICAARCPKAAAG